MRLIIIWAGGTGVSGIAHTLHELGYTGIIAIDSSDGQLIQGLKKAGIRTIIGESGLTINPDDVVIYSVACEQSPEVQQSLALLNDPTVAKHYSFSYFQFLGAISKYCRTLGFAGTNGKSSSTALAIYTASHAPGLPVAYGILGALVPQLGQQNHRINPQTKSDLRLIFDAILSGKPIADPSLIKKYRFIVEACEFRHHFLNLDLEIAAITNIDYDHSDYFKTVADYEEAFAQLIKKSKTPALFPTAHKHYSLPHLIGEHRQDNASLVVQSLSQIGLEEKGIEKTMATFTGLRRRCELLDQKDFSYRYSDYAHHAPALEAVYAGMREKYPDHRIVAVFQPHQAKRVLQGRDDLAEVLKQFDEVHISTLYTARESLETLRGEFQEFDFEEIKNFTDLGTKFAEHCGGVYHTDVREIYALRENPTKNTVFVMMTAGDLDRQWRNYFKKGL